MHNINEISGNVLNQVSGGCEHEVLLDDIEATSETICDALPCVSDVEENIKNVPEKVHTFFAEL